jgi:hypothetical protein
MTITTGVTGNPSFVQAIPGTYGTMGNYELVTPLATGGLASFYRDNDDPSLPWYGPTATFATDQGLVTGCSLIQSNFSSSASAGMGQGPGNLAVVANASGNLLYYFREDVEFTWSGATTIATGVYGVPSFVQAMPGTFGTMGNYELVTPLSTGGMAHYYRDNDNPSVPWTQTAVFGTQLGLVDAVCLIQSNFSTAATQSLGTYPSAAAPGNLAVVALSGGNLYYFYRDDVTPFNWNGPTTTITSGVQGNVSFIQAKPGTYGNMGNYELVAPLQTGGIVAFERNNDNPNLPWAQTAVFGTDQGLVNDVCLIQSNFSSLYRDTGVQGPGNLAVVANIGGTLDYFYRDDY